MTDATTTTERCTITLTNQPPVTIAKDDWPVIARASHEFRANCTWRWSLRVRQHADGRAIVYGGYDYDTQYRGDTNIRLRAGVLFTLAAPSSPEDRGDVIDIPRAIADVATQLATQMLPGHEDHLRWASLAAACIADLPAVEL